MSTQHTPSELVLGTAQLSDPQGPDEIRDASTLVISAALNAGVKWIETSPAYGDAEARIGRALRTGRRAHVTTRLGSLSSTDATMSVRDLIIENVSRACTRLNVGRLDVLTLDSIGELKAHGGLVWRTLKELRDDGAIYDLGVAVTSPEEALVAIADPAITYLQLQFNALDWRWREAGVIDALADRPEILVHAHSALLYGMLAAAPGAKWPASNAVDPEHLRLMLWTLAKDMGRDCPADLCIAYVRAQPWIHGVIAGARSASQMALNISRFRRPALTRDEIERVNSVMPHVPVSMLGVQRMIRAA